MLLAMMAAVWVADIGAFFVGRRFGRVKLAPSISPGKSRKGPWRSQVAVWVYGALVLTAGFQDKSLGWWDICLRRSSRWLLTVSASWATSWNRRQAAGRGEGQRKILPGHGGVLDRIDSLTAALPWLLLLALMGLLR